MSDDKYSVDPTWCSSHPGEAAAELASLHRWCDELEAERDKLAREASYHQQEIETLLRKVDLKERDYQVMNKFREGAEAERDELVAQLPHRIAVEKAEELESLAKGFRHNAENAAQASFYEKQHAWDDAADEALLVAGRLRNQVQGLSNG